MQQEEKRKFPVGRLLYSAIVLILLLLLAIGAAVFNRYTQEQLYQESVNQLTEISTQLFEKLDVQLNIQWSYLEKLDDGLSSQSSMSVEELSAYLQLQESELCPVGESLQFIAIDESDYYYSDQGKQGIWTGADDLRTDASEQSFLITDWITNDNFMVFVRKLENPLRIGRSSIRYLAVLRSMDDMAPYFRSSAFHNQNTTYVIDENGVKMFMDSVVPELDFSVRNIYHALRTETYPHMGSLDACLEVVQKDTFVCTDVMIGGKAFYLAIKSLKGYDWSMLIFVPAGEVAASTRAMTNSIVRIFILILIAIVALSILSFLFVTRFRKNQKLLAIKTKSEAKLAETNHKLEQTNEELEKAQKTTRDALQMAEAASKAKTDFLSNMSHDIRTPMNAIIGLTTLMKSEPGLSDRMSDYLTKLETSGQHLLELINNVLDMNRIESGKTTLTATSVNLAEQIAQVETIIGSQASQRSQKFTIITTHLNHEYIITDPARLQQILINILSNAVKYTPKGGHILFEIAELPRDEHYAKYKFIVQDDGIGMSEEFLQHIFDPFSRMENSVTNQIQGTGLGMAITKNVVDLMGGVIHVESDLGKGSRFEVTLEFPIDAKADHTTQHLSILLMRCENEEDLSRVQDAIADKPVRLHRTRTLEEGFDALRSASYDVVLLPLCTKEEDVCMIRELAGTDTILLGASDGQSDAGAVKGMDGVLTYPFFLSNLESEVQRVQQARKEADRPEERSPLCGMKFLCAEDNEINAEILKMLLETKGASCTIYRNGQEIVDAFADVRPGEYDMILMDVQMPVMDGLEATRRIRSGQNPLGKTIPILAMTANAFLEDRQQSRDAGMDEHLSKPVDINALEQAVRRFRLTPPERITNGKARFARFRRPL